MANIKHEHSGTKIMMWIALIASGLALVVAVAALDRTERDLDSVIAREAQEARERIDQLAALAEARIKLVELQSELASNLAGDQAAQEVEDIRIDLQEAYVDTEEQVRERWVAIDEQLGQLKIQAREDAREARATIDNIIKELRERRIDE